MMFMQSRVIAKGRTCFEIYASNPGSPSGTYVIDPEETGNETLALTVYCNMTTQTTYVGHEAEKPFRIPGCAPAGCYNVTIEYNKANNSSKTISQMKALARLSGSCRQYFKFNCLGVPFDFNGKSFAWWVDSEGTNQTYWAGKGTEHACGCASNSSCIDESVKCNCDYLGVQSAYDEGYITNKDHLPVTKLFFGRTHIASSIAIHSLGQFECSGRPALTRPPVNCTELLQAGHTLNGVYTIKDGDSIRNVFCDFTKEPNEEGLQKEIGEVDVKTKPVYFHFQRKLSLSLENIIGFEVGEVNVGSAMNLNGTFYAPVGGIYSFTFNGAGDYTVALRRNSTEINRTTNSMSVTLDLEKGDFIDLRLEIGSLVDTSPNYSTYFSGVLLKEHLP